VQERVKKNTALYREVFKCYPDDYVKTLADLTLLRSAGKREQLYDECRDKIVGFAVQFPL
jgi:phospholipase D1/2